MSQSHLSREEILTAKDKPCINCGFTPGNLAHLCNKPEMTAQPKPDLQSMYGLPQELADMKRERDRLQAELDETHRTITERTEVYAASYIKDVLEQAAVDGLDARVIAERDKLQARVEELEQHVEEMAKRDAEIVALKRERDFYQTKASSASPAKAYEELRLKMWAVCVETPVPWKGYPTPEQKMAGSICQLIDELGKAEAELSRAKRALRAHLEDGPDFWRRCPTCNGKWQVRPDRTESHNPVKLDGDIEPGKCPAEPEVHDV